MDAVLKKRRAVIGIVSHARWPKTKAGIIIFETVLNDHGADATLAPMKFFLALMIFALAFGGYSAASHASGMKDCSSMAQQASDDCDHANASTHHDHVKKHEKAAGKCMDCGHCCASSMALTYDKSWVPPMTAISFGIEPAYARAQDRIFSLLRPPRTIA